MTCALCGNHMPQGCAAEEGEGGEGSSISPLHGGTECHLSL